MSVLENQPTVHSGGVSRGGFVAVAVGNAVAVALAVAVVVDLAVAVAVAVGFIGSGATIRTH